MLNPCPDFLNQPCLWWTQGRQHLVASSTTRKLPAIPPAEPLCSMQLHNNGVADFPVSADVQDISFSAVWFLASQLVISLHLSRISYLSLHAITSWILPEVFPFNSCFHVECTGLRQIPWRHFVPLLIFSFVLFSSLTICSMSSFMETPWFK